MNIIILKKHFFTELKTLFDLSEIESFFFILTEYLHNLKRIDISLHPNFEVSETDLEKWNTIIAELKTEKPIQYITGEAWFYGYRFEVNQNTLIPRPETEELVEWIIESQKSKVESQKSKVESQKSKVESQKSKVESEKSKVENQKSKVESEKSKVESQKSKVESEKSNTENLTIQQSNNLSILDIGTGSGCIPIALKKELPFAEVFAIDVSEKALEMAQKNANTNQVEIIFKHQDILKTESLHFVISQPHFFDVIVSNPPYVRNVEKYEIKKNVLNFEPHLALFVENSDALVFYKKIAQLAITSLAPKGKLFFEINQYLAKETVALLENIGFKNIELRQDFMGNNRMICCTI